MKPLAAVESLSLPLETLAPAFVSTLFFVWKKKPYKILEGFLKKYRKFFVRLIHIRISLLVINT